MLDILDRKILLALDCNSRQSVSDLARSIKQGRDRVEYHLDKLLEQKIIQKFAVYINLYKLGFTLYKSYIRLENKKERIQEFISYLENHPRLYWLALCDGGWDLVLVFFAESAHEFHEIHTKLLSRFNDLVLNFSAYTIVDFRSYSRNYLAKDTRITTHVGGRQQDIEIDDTDYKILEVLAEDARAPSVEIGEKLNLSHQVVRYRIDRLEKQRIINGYRLELDLGKIGVLFFKTQFFLRNYELGLRRKLRSFCEAHPRIVSYIEQVGDCNVEIELEVNDYEQYAEIIDEIRGEYSTLVRNFQSMLIRKAYRYPMPR